MVRLLSRVWHWLLRHLLGPAMQNQDQQRKAALDLPAEYLTQIGAISFQWALFDHHLTKAVSILLDINIKPARVVLGSVKTLSKLDVVMDLLLIQGLDTIRQTLADHQTILQGADSIRNLLAHCPWVFVEEENAYYAIGYSGKWKPPGAKEKVSKRVKPLGSPIDLTWLTDTAGAFTSYNRWIAVVLRDLIAGLPPSPHRFL